jgi:dienelactone hydrolase
VLVGDPNLKTHTLYRPRDLKLFGAAVKLPVVAYGNGGCRNGSHEVRNLLTEVASHGFLVIAIGPAASAATGMVAGSSQSRQLLDAFDWAAAENARNGSEFFGKVDTSKVAVMGQSCGGLQAIEVSNDPRITTTVMLNSGILSRPMATPPGAGLVGMPAVTKEQLAKLHGPIAYFIGGRSDIAYPNAVDDFARIDRVPVFMGNQDVGHYPATYQEPRGGAFGVAASAWLKWQLKDDPNAAKMFTGPKCGLCTDPKWTVQKKNIE